MFQRKMEKNFVQPAVVNLVLMLASTPSLHSKLYVLIFSFVKVKSSPVCTKLLKSEVRRRSRHQISIIGSVTSLLGSKLDKI